MKKKTLLIASTFLFVNFYSQVSFADYADIDEGVAPIARFWGGFSFADQNDSINPGAPEAFSVPEATTRKGSKKAAEYYSTDSSAAFGFLYKANYLPHRVHMEADVMNEDDWYGDFRYSYKDYALVRFLPRRLYHNLDNIRMFDYDGDYNAPFTHPNYGVGFDANAAIQLKDTNIDDYGLKIDIDDFKLRLKTPNYPLHAYINGEIVKREGKQQMRFLGGNAWHNGILKVSESRDIDQQNKEYIIGTNAHLGPVEIDLSHTQRRFENDVATPLNYYTNVAFGAGNIRSNATGVYGHNVIPTLKAETNTVKIHTSHTGRIVASATLSDISKSNEYSGARASNTMAYSDITWLPLANLSFAAKYRHQRNRASNDGTPTVYNVNGTADPDNTYADVGNQTDYVTASLTGLYSPFSKLNLKAEYIKNIKDVSAQTTFDYSRPLKTTKDTYALKANWRAMDKVKVTGKISHQDTRTEFGSGAQLGGGFLVNNEPEKSTRGIFGISWTPSARISTFFNADITKEKGSDYRVHETNETDLSGENFYQRYLASLSFMVNEKFSITPSYTFISREQEQDIIWEDSTPVHYIDRDYESEQKAHNFAVHFMYLPTKKLDLNATVDYTVGKGTYEPVQTPIDFTLIPGGTDNPVDLRQIGINAYTHTQELNLRFEGNYDMGNGWGAGLEMRYTDWIDSSFDNPSDSEFIGGLVKITKKLTL